MPCIFGSWWKAAQGSPQAEGDGVSWWLWHTAVFKSKWANSSPVVLAVPYLTAEVLQSLQLPSGIPCLVRCQSTDVGTTPLLKSYGVAAPKIK